MEGDDMTTTSAPRPPAVAARPGPHRRRRCLPAAAGTAYLVAWAAGLAAWPSNLALNATSAQATAAYAAHPAGAVVQYLLVEGLAGLLLAVVLGRALLPLVRRRRAGARPAAGLAGAAVVISLVQCVLGPVLVAAATSADVARAGGLSALENRLDGVKMLALAAVAAYLAVTRITAGEAATPAGAAPRARPRWLRATALLAAIALAASAAAYLFLANALAWTVYLSGPLLLVWIAATGAWLTFAAADPGVAPGAAA
jgi:hypothetical protein